MPLAPKHLTELHEHPKRPSRVVLEIDGADAGTVPLDLVAELGLRVGAALTPRTLRDIEIAVRRTQLLDKALDLLAVRARSVRDVRTRLKRSRPHPNDVDWVVTRLRAQGYLDDAQYARQVAQNRIVGGKVSRRRVRDELYRRGVPLETASDAIEETLAEVELDEFGAAWELATKRNRTLSKLDKPTRRRRLYAYLARRGYESELISRVLRRLDKETGD